MAELLEKSAMNVPDQFRPEHCKAGYLSLEAREQPPERFLDVAACYRLAAVIMLAGGLPALALRHVPTHRRAQPSLSRGLNQAHLP
jgi:hypothetical protein